MNSQTKETLTYLQLCKKILPWHFSYQQPHMKLFLFECWEKRCEVWDFGVIQFFLREFNRFITFWRVAAFVFSETLCFALCCQWALQKVRSNVPPSQLHLPVETALTDERPLYHCGRQHIMEVYTACCLVCLCSQFYSLFSGRSHYYDPPRNKNTVWSNKIKHNAAILKKLLHNVVTNDKAVLLVPSLKLYCCVISVI